jgi:hypothetical protein
MVDFTRTKDVEDVGWEARQDFHVYENAERAKGDGVGVFGTSDAFGAKAAFDIRIAKARALDKARAKLIRAVHQTKTDVFGLSFVQPDQVTRSVDGVEGAPDSAIML